MRGGLLAAVAVLGVLISGCEPTDGSVYAPGTYSVRESGVALRDGAAACRRHPGTGNCPDVLFGLTPEHKLYPLCQRPGQLVGQNTYWVYVDGPRGNRGWVASWYLDWPSNRLPELDDCTADHLKPIPW